MPHRTSLHRYELMEDRRRDDRRSGDGRAEAVANRRAMRTGDRRGGQSVAESAVVRRVWPLVESDDVSPSTRERRQAGLLLAADGTAGAVAAWLAWELTGDAASWRTVVLGAVAVAVLATAVGAGGKDHLVLRRSTLDEAHRLLEVSGLTVLGLWLVGEPALERSTAVVLLPLLAVMLAGLRAATRLALRHTTPPEQCLVIGDREVGDQLRNKVALSRANAVVSAVLPLRPGQTADAIGGLDGLRRLVRDNAIERVIIAPVTTDAVDTLELIRMAKQACTRVSLFPRLFEVVGTAVEFEDLDGLTLIGVRRFGLSRAQRATKRAFDLAVGLIATVALAPLMVLVALLVRFDGGGPVLFRQKRVGRDGQHFDILKFRSMTVDAERLKDDLRHRNETVGLFKIADDPRVTRIGRVLRKTSLDELPQLLNVVKGDMSLVGPRPLVIDEDAQVLGLDRSRLHLTPGMTGPWQVLRSGRVPMEEMVGMDYLYVANWSLWTDLKLLVRTAFYVFARGGV
jgi:exopolysaccharide biosynthesis polyprenyl glycosylphosphotransferase